MVRKGTKMSLESRRKMSESHKGKRLRENHPLWKGGFFITSSGYKKILMPEHQRTTKDGYVAEHIVVAEEKLGRPLKPGEVVHHINMVKLDNNPENLYTTTNSLNTKAHKSYNILCKRLLDKKIIYFDKEKGEYYFCN